MNMNLSRKAPSISEAQYKATIMLDFKFEFQVSEVK